MSERSGSVEGGSGFGDPFGIAAETAQGLGESRLGGDLIFASSPQTGRRERSGCLLGRPLFVAETEQDFGSRHLQTPGDQPLVETPQLLSRFPQCRPSGVGFADLALGQLREQ